MAHRAAGWVDCYGTATGGVKSRRNEGTTMDQEDKRNPEDVTANEPTTADEPATVDEAATVDEDVPAPSLVLGDEDEHDIDLHEEPISSEIAWSGKIFDVERMQVRLPNGRTSVRDIVRHHGAVAIVALTETGKIALVRQYRASLGRVTVEIPAGKLEPGEDPLACARRELKEETGFVPGRIAYLTTIASSCGFSDELIHIYLATQLDFEGAQPDEDEFLNVDLVPVNELVDAVLDGKIEDAKTVVGALACDVMAHRLAVEE